MAKNKTRIQSKGKSKSKRSIHFRDFKRSNSIESSLSKEDVDEQEDTNEETESDQNDDESPKTEEICFDLDQNIELPFQREQKHVVMLLLKVRGEENEFLTIYYGYKGYDYDKGKFFYKDNNYRNFSKMARTIQNYANGFFEFEIDGLTPQRFFERFKSDMILLKVPKNKGDKNATNRHFLNYYIRFWNGLDVKLSTLTFSGRPNYEKLALTIFRIGLGASNDMKKKFLDLIPNHCKDGKLQKSVAVLEVMNEIFERGLGRESGFPKDNFLEYLNKNSEFLKIIDLGGKNGKD